MSQCDMPSDHEEVTMTLMTSAVSVTVTSTRRQGSRLSARSDIDKVVIRWRNTDISPNTNCVKLFRKCSIRIKMEVAVSLNYPPLPVNAQLHTWPCCSNILQPLRDWCDWSDWQILDSDWTVGRLSQARDGVSKRWDSVHSDGSWLE